MRAAARICLRLIVPLAFNILPGTHEMSSICGGGDHRSPTRIVYSVYDLFGIGGSWCGDAGSSFRQQRMYNRAPK